MDNSSNLVKFRSAVSGFNRSDVIRYIELRNQEHQQEKKALEDELAAVRAKLEAAQAEIQSLRQENQSFQDTLEALTTPDIAEESEEEIAEEAPEEAICAELPEAVPSSLVQEELAAYRRAEAAERLAHQRADDLHARILAVERTHLVRMDAVCNEAGSLYTEVSNDLERLREALADLHVLFQKTNRELLQMAGQNSPLDEVI